MSGYANNTKKAFGKGLNDIGHEFQRVQAHPENAAWAAAPFAGGGLMGAVGANRHFGGYPNIRNSWMNQLDPRYAQNQRDQQNLAHRKALMNQRMATQQAYAGGYGGGGAQLGSEIQAYNDILAQFSAQQYGQRQAAANSDMESIGQIMELLGKLGYL